MELLVLLQNGLHKDLLIKHYQEYKFIHFLSELNFSLLKSEIILLVMLVDFFLRISADEFGSQKRKRLLITDRIQILLCLSV